MGDQVLTCFYGDHRFKYILTFPTYTYTNMNGAGDRNHHKNLALNNRHTEWFYIYYGYNRDERIAYVYVRWLNSENSLDFNNVNHYYTPLFHIYVGRDHRF